MLKENSLILHGRPMSTSSEELTTEQEVAETFNKDMFRRHVIQLFGRERGGHMARWVYMDIKRGGDLSTGSGLWRAFVKAGLEGNNNYTYPNKEADLIKTEQTRQKLAELFHHVSTIVDFGSGDEFAVVNKAVPIIKGLSNVRTYRPLDISEVMLMQATKAANDNLQGHKPNVAVSPILGDFSSGKTLSDNKPIIFAPENEDRLGIFLGSTITNQEMNIDIRNIIDDNLDENEPYDPQDFPRAEVVEKIKMLGDILNSGHRDGPLTGKHGLVVGYDSNLDPESAKNAYVDSGDLKIWGPLVTGVMFDIKTALDPQTVKNGGFDPQGWHHEKIVRRGPPLNEDDPNSSPQYIVVHQCVVADKSQHFKIDDGHGNARSFAIKEGDIFVIKNNFKFHPMFFRQLAREARFNPLDAIQIENNNAVLQPLEVSY